jgi:hypothetical protein
MHTLMSTGSTKFSLIPPPRHVGLQLPRGGSLLDVWVVIIHSTFILTGMSMDAVAYKLDSM